MFHKVFGYISTLIVLLPAFGNKFMDNIVSVDSNRQTVVSFLDVQSLSLLAVINKETRTALNNDLKKFKQQHIIAHDFLTKWSELLGELGRESHEDDKNKAIVDFLQSPDIYDGIYAVGIRFGLNSDKFVDIANSLGELMLSNIRRSITSIAITSKTNYNADESADERSHDLLQEMNIFLEKSPNNPINKKFIEIIRSPINDGCLIM